MNKFNGDFQAMVDEIVENSEFLKQLDFIVENLEEWPSVGKGASAYVHPVDDEAVAIIFLHGTALKQAKHEGFVLVSEFDYHMEKVRRKLEAQSMGARS